MLFNSYAFWMFLALVWVMYRLLPHRGQNVLLLVARSFFYGCWDWKFIPLILTVTLVNYFTALGMEKTASKSVHRTYMTVSAIVSLGLLAFFKYWGFFTESAAEMLTSTEDKVDTIAHSLGYANPFAFSNAFLKWIGVRPSEHRAEG